MKVKSATDDNEGTPLRNDRRTHVNNLQEITETNRD